MKLPHLNQKPKQADHFDPFPDLSQAHPPKKAVQKEHLFLATAVIVFVASLGVYLAKNPTIFGPPLNQDSYSPQAEAGPTPLPKVLPTGKQSYRYSHGPDVVGPKLQTVTIDPFDPQIGQTIEITAKIKYDSPVTKTTAVLVTDHQTTSQDMKLDSGEKTNGTWKTTFKLNDTYLYTYQLNFYLHSETDNYQGGMTFRP